MRRRENQSTRRKTSQSKGELNPHIQARAGFEPEPFWWEAIALTSTLPLLPNMYEYEENQKKTFIKKFKQQQCAHLCLISQIIIFLVLIIFFN